MAYDWRKEEYEVTRPSRTRIDYRQEIGRAHVPIGVERDFAVVDADRASALRAWVSTLIPSRGARPAAGELGAAEYVDATVFLTPRLRGVLLDGIDTVDQLAVKLVGCPFAEATLEDRFEVLRAFEANDPLDAFSMVRDLTYEAYYAHPRVLEVLERETGWRYEVAFSGGELEPFDESLLARMRTVAPRWRKA
ncbi:MAG TPA: gluconate 2-dehydrogenase subunit 3 family protein [Thermomicrobiales bacterium]|nr:gluconate 2-dehydrogenase subunit 3 family protein [Thermomicrobiales bacterium]